MRKRRTVAALAAVVVGLAACSSSGADNPRTAPASTPSTSSGPTLLRALAQVEDTGRTRTSVSFVRTHDVVTAKPGGEAADPDYIPTASALGNYSQATSDALGIDLRGVDYSVGDTEAGLLVGATLHDVDAKMHALGATSTSSGGVVTYRLQPDGADYGNDKLDAALPSIGGLLNVVEIDGTTVRYGWSSDWVTTVEPDGPTLAQDPDYLRVARCLGDPLSAYLSTKPVTGRLIRRHGILQPPARTAGLRVVGASTSDAGSTTSYRMCVALDSKQDAQQAARSARQTIRHGRLVSGLHPKWSAVLKHVSIEVRGPLVTVDGRQAKGSDEGLGELPGIYG